MLRSKACNALSPCLLLCASYLCLGQEAGHTDAGGRSHAKAVLHVTDPLVPLPSAIFAVARRRMGVMPLSAGEEKGARSKGRPPATPWMRMLRHPAVWAIILNNFTFHYAFYVVMNWLPTYFDQVCFCADNLPAVL